MTNPPTPSPASESLPPAEPFDPTKTFTTRDGRKVSQPEADAKRAAELHLQDGARTRPLYATPKAALRAAAPEPAEAFGMTQDDGWQPIATAPKDGTVFLAVCMEAQTPKSKIAWFESDDRCVTIWKPEKFVCGGPNRWWPTHWRPLPAPPTPTPTGGTRDGKALHEEMMDCYQFGTVPAPVNPAPAPGRDAGEDYTDDAYAALSTIGFRTPNLVQVANMRQALRDFSARRAHPAGPDGGVKRLVEEVAEAIWRARVNFHGDGFESDMLTLTQQEPTIRGSTVAEAEAAIETIRKNGGTVSEAEVEAAHAQARWWHPYHCTKADIRAVLEAARKATPAPGAKQ